MSWLSKIFGKKETPVENTKVSFDQVFLKIEEKSRESVEKDKQIKQEILTFIKTFNNQLSENIKILEKITLAERKEYQHIKRITLDNLRFYIDHLKQLIHNLKNIEDLDYQNYLNKIVRILNDFNKTSNPYFERATILIGKELEVVKELINNFTKGIVDIANNHKGFVKEKELMSKIELVIKEFKDNGSLLDSLDENTDKLNQELESLKNNYDELKQKIQDIIGSDRHKLNIQEKEKRRNDLNELEKEIRELKQKIDFKLLAKYFHFDEKNTQIIKDYSEDFKLAIVKDSNLELAELAKKAQGLVLTNLKEIQSKVTELNRQFVSETDKEIGVLEENIKKIDSEKNNKDREIQEEIDKKEKFYEKSKELKTRIETIFKELFSNIEIQSSGFE
jgi:hypothetical protein